MEMNPSPTELRRRIDEALAEIERVEAEVIALFEDLGGPDLAHRLVTYYEEAASAPRVAPLVSPDGADPA